ncbi:hypothetical protein LTR27_009085 [Elasticomyces elasticus]|nr:hypothetical protein LTR27_009085 [Elasticomyces elasticus]
MNAQQRETAFWQQLPFAHKMSAPGAQVKTTMTKRSGVAFRVIVGDGMSPNYTRLGARHPQAAQTVRALRDHLKWYPTNTPYMVLCLLELESSIAKGSVVHVYIIMIDMEMLGQAIDAVGFAIDYKFARPQLHDGEYLDHGIIPDKAVLAIVDAASPRAQKYATTGTLSAPQDLWLYSEQAYRNRLTGDGDWRNIEALREWYFDYCWERDFTFDRINMERFIESMFICTPGD